MKNVCFYFQVHQPFRLRTYRFFDIGHDHHYFDDYSNKAILEKIAKKCYLPVNKLLLEQITKHKGKFKVAFSITGSVLDQFELYAPEVLDSFKKLAATGCVEFLAETYSHSLVALKSEDEFRQQVSEHVAKIKHLFGQEPSVFRNTELVYSDGIGQQVANMGFKAMLTEGARHILGWKSPNYLYCNAINPKLKVLLRNYKLSDDIAFRFCNQSWGEWPLTPEKFVTWLNTTDSKEEVVNLFMDYETFGEHQSEDTGIFEFMRALPTAIIASKKWQFATPSEVADTLQPISVLNVPHPISWADEERDLTAWLGNSLQHEAFNNLYSLAEQVAHCADESIQRDWRRLQTSDHFYYMCTKFFADGAVHSYFNPYNSPYEAFINYMNVFSDFVERIKKAPKSATRYVALPPAEALVTPEPPKPLARKAAPKAPVAAEPVVEEPKAAKPAAKKKAEATVSEVAPATEAPKTKKATVKPVAEPKIETTAKQEVNEPAAEATTKAKAKTTKATKVAEPKAETAKKANPKADATDKKASAKKDEDKPKKTTTKKEAK